MEKTKPFKVAVIGTGSSAHDHVAAFKQAGVEIAAVVGRNDRQRHAFASKFGVPIQANEYQEVLDIPDIDAVAICLPNYLHAPVAVEAMRAGKHVLTEKPMALDGAAAEEMVRVQRETGKTLMVSLQVRYSPAARLARQYAAEFGSIYYGKCAYLRRSGIPGRISPPYSLGASPLRDHPVSRAVFRLWQLLQSGCKLSKQFGPLQVNPFCPSVKMLQGSAILLSAARPVPYKGSDSPAPA